ncbi:Acylamino-acid-releasing enzyme [Liparis tanakae]|uniref:acylaminoacyl-peptidase n=1 Tax=Liparis tanakae TaxID=230148 RepID=A0A4Z2H7N6_9TELE|nr:Acylamino-acid-releasing enzyme [Liparis tanakae]
MDPARVTAVYGEVSGLPAPVSAHVREEEQLSELRTYTVTAEWSQSDLVRGSRIRYSQQWTLITDSNDHKSIRTVLPPGPCVPVSGEVLSGISPIQGLRAVVRETSGHQLLEDRSVYCEDWGESLTNKSVPVICVVNLLSGAVSVLQGVPRDVSPGQLDLCSRRTSTLLDVVNTPQTGFSDLPDYGSWKLLTVQKDLMVVCCSSPNTPPTLRVGFLPSAGEAVTWQTLQQPFMTFDFHWTVLDVTPPPEEDNTHYSGLDFGAILVKPSGSSNEAKTPLVVSIHGGPHSQFPAEWNCTTAGLAKLGFAVLMVNYRGSTGFGQDSILSLIGRIGSQDVKDVQTAVRTALQGDIGLDPDRLAVIGGSHGGFLSCHLVGQYPEFYRACAARNPVINAATLLGTSDIVDWRYTSVGIQYSYDQIPTAEALAAMLEKSPITHAAQIKAPVLLMLGARDRRVSPHQGLELYKALKSRASPVRLLWFPEDGHSLSRVDTQADCFLNTVLWLHQHL